MDMNPTAAFLPVVNKKKEEIYIEACFHHEKKKIIVTFYLTDLIFFTEL